MKYEPHKYLAIIKQMRRFEKTFRDIGEVLGLSGQRIEQIFKAKPKYDFSGIKLKGRDFLKEKRRIIDNRTCYICGKKQNGRRLDVIHVGKEKCVNCKNLAHYRSMCHECKCKLN